MKAQKFSTPRTLRSLNPVSASPRKSARGDASAGVCNSASSTSGTHTSETTLASYFTLPPPLDLQQMSVRQKLNDISYRQDQKAFLSARIPPTKIPEQDFILEKQFFPTRGSVFCSEDGMWHRTLFPSERPCERVDAVYLDHWITKAIETYAVSMEQKSMSDQVDDIVPILENAMHEIVRHTIHFCEERATVLETVWCAYMDLFNHVLREMQHSLQKSKERVHETELTFSAESAKCEQMHAEHPHELQRLISELELKFAKHSESLVTEVADKEEATKKIGRQMTALNTSLKEWFPNCGNILNDVLNLNFEDDHVDSNEPIVLCVTDIQRIIRALNPKQRIQLRGLLKETLRMDYLEAEAGPQAEKINELIADIAEQESLIQKLLQGKTQSKKRLEKLMSQY